MLLSRGYAFADLRDIDLARGAITLDKNKSDDPRVWALDSGAVQALRVWKKHRQDASKPDERVFVDEFGRPFEDEAWPRRCGTT